LTTYNNFFALWVILGGVAAYFWPGAFLPLRPFLDIFFALTMFGVGMVLDPRAFVDIFKQFKTVIIGVFSQFTIMPGLAFLIAALFRFNDDFTLGLILAGSAPGAMASNVLSYLAGADVAYSVSLTTASTLLSPVLTPLLTLFLAHTMLDIPFWGMFFNVLWMVVLPLLLGIGLKYLLHEKVEPFVKVFPAISTTFIVFICALVIALNNSYLGKINVLIFIAAIVLNVLGLTLGYAVGHISKFNITRKRALSIEIGMQNAGLGSVLALKHFNERAALPAVVFVFICIFTASLLVPLWARKGNIVNE
jgi:BASS family bile acid:Na+ symporter